MMLCHVCEYPDVSQMLPKLLFILVKIILKVLKIISLKDCIYTLKDMAINNNKLVSSCKQAANRERISEVHFCCHAIPCHTHLH